MSTVVISWNVRGLNDAVKRGAVFSFIQSHDPALVCLQETHLEENKLNVISKRRYATQFHSTYSSYARGVSLLIAARVRFSCRRAEIDPKGRYVFLYCELEGFICVIASIYIPPPYKVEVLRHLLDFLALIPEVPVLILGDFNCCLDPKLDRWSASGKEYKDSSSQLARLLSEVGWWDFWRTRHPHETVFSCFSKTHMSLSRIDLVIGNEGMVNRVGDIQYLARGLSDHTPLRIHLKVNELNLKKFWKLNQYWLKVIEDHDSIGRDLEMFLNNNLESAHILIVWDTLKAYLRGLFNAKITAIKKKSRQEEEGSQLAVRVAEQNYIQDPTSNNLKNWEEKQLKYEEQIKSKAIRQRCFQKQAFFEEGEKVGKLLATIARSQSVVKPIMGLKAEDGELLYTTEAMTERFRSYFEELYSSKNKIDDEICELFLSEIELPSLQQVERVELDAPISLEELQAAIEMMPPNKAPGLDGLPIETYKVYGKVLVPALLQTLNGALVAGALPASMREAVIVVIPKEGKDPYFPDSYRPISLLSTDVKILAKVLAIRLTKVIAKLIHPDQSGFVPNRSTADNIRRLFLNIQTPIKNTGRRAILSLDASKAFDSVEWHYLWRVLEKFGFGPCFISWIKLLYSLPMARVSVNGNLSDSFGLQRGTRQGCPLSPLLFALAIEPLASAIRGSTAMRGFIREVQEDKISLYADDVIIYLGDTAGSLATGMNIIERFGKLSGYKVNWDKSVLLPLDPLSDSFSIGIDKLRRVTSFKYLGVIISPDIDSYVTLNLEPLLCKFRASLLAWCKLPLSVVGRANLVKMIWLPQLMYVFCNSPMWIPQVWFKRIDTMIRKLVWRKKQARIRLNILQLPKDEGGLALPHVWLYFLAAQLQHMGGWKYFQKDNPVHRIIGSLVGCDPLVMALEGGKFGKMGKMPTYKLINKVWEVYKKKMQYTGITQYTPLWENVGMMELSKIGKMQNWWNKGITRISQLFEGGKLRSYNSIAKEYNLQKNTYFQYLQIRHAIKAQGKMDPILIKSYPLLEKLVASMASKRGLISQVYMAMLRKSIPDYRSTPGFRGWLLDVGELEEEEWKTALEGVQYATLSTSQRLTQIYILHRTYITPQKMYRWGRSISPNCPKCQCQEGDLIHMLWRCPKLKRYWNLVFQTINVIAGSELEMEPKIALLGILPTAMEVNVGSVLINRLLFLARKMIARYWISPTPPSHEQWILEVINTMKMEKIYFHHRGLTQKFNRIWSGWKV